MKHLLLLFVAMGILACSPRVNNKKVEAATEAFALVSKDSISGNDIYIIRHKSGFCFALYDGQFSGGIIQVPSEMCR